MDELSKIATDELIIRKLREKHGLSEDSARWLFARLRRSLALDIIDETGMPIALYDDDDAVQTGNEAETSIAVVTEHH
jgi:hypothetical protein